jgi:hypothetical protein
MKFGKMVATAAGAAALASMVALGGPAAWAQDATPQAETMVPRPAHIHTGTCDEVGEVVGPLTDLTGATGGDRVGQARRAISAESSFTNVPLTLDAILGADHVVNVHLSAEEIDTYIACGEIGGMLTPEGAVIIGLHELDCLPRARSGRRLDRCFGLCCSDSQSGPGSQPQRRRGGGVRHPRHGGHGHGHA